MRRPGPPPPPRVPGRRLEPADQAPRRCRRQRERDEARRKFIRSFGFDPRRERHPEAPRTRGECRNLEGLRPCPWAGCRAHLALDVRPAKRPGLPPTIKLVFGSDDPATWPEDVCAFDIVEHYDYEKNGVRPDEGGAMRFIEIAKRYNLTLERVRQICRAAEVKARLAARELGVPVAPVPVAAASLRAPSPPAAAEQLELPPDPRPRPLEPTPAAAPGALRDHVLYF